MTREGFDYQTGVNYLGHVELTRILLEGLLLQQVTYYFVTGCLSFKAVQAVQECCDTTTLKCIVQVLIAFNSASPPVSKEYTVDKQMVAFR